MPRSCRARHRFEQHEIKGWRRLLESETQVASTPWAQGGRAFGTTIRAEAWRSAFLMRHSLRAGTW